MFSIIFGSVGLGYFVYGRKQQKAVPLIAGILLGIFPYFISNVYAMLIVGITLIALPFLIKA